MSDTSGNSGSAFSLTPWAARRMGHDVDEKDSWCPVIGFRLTHDHHDRFIHGGSWNYTAELASDADGGSYFPGGSYVFLGVRLIYDREET